ncbi:MAG: hypothetical protein K0Q72_1727 [Armatimonadetes bacterium]|nr:hypothetical protein [Armatimonadota bacterium]
MTTKAKGSGGKTGGGSKPRKSGGAAPLSGADRWRLAASGFILGKLTWHMALELGIGTLPIPGEFHQFGVAGFAAALLFQTRLRNLVWVTSGLVCLLLLGVGYSGIIKQPTRSILRADPLRPADAVVVLSSTIRKSGEMDTAFQNRVIHGYEVVGQGFAPRLLVTHLGPSNRNKSYIPAVRRQLDKLGIDFPVQEVGPVWDTHDEAVAVAKLFREKRWKRVIVVSDPTHLRRAGATFEKAGLQVICSPCRSPEFDPASLERAGEKLAACREWFHEVIGYEVYRLRGWL